MLKLEWSKLSSFNLTNIESIGDISGVYRLSYKSSDNSFYVFYVGYSSGLLKNDLRKIITETDNQCIKTYLDNLECFFRYAQTSSLQDSIQDVERTLYEHFKPKCNLEVPQGSSVEINYN